jgi:hypothetical protein
MSERGARACLLALLVLLCGWMLRVDLAKLSGGNFWGDGATYHAMAWSLAEDGDIRYEAKDVFRSRREFSGGPQGVFLKRVYGGTRLDFAMGWPWLHRLPDDEQRIYFAKSLAYPLAAAPFVRLFGTPGMLVLNALSLWLTVVFAYLELRRHASPGVALLGSLALICGTVAPLYLIWPTSELFTVAVIAGSLFAWRREWPIVAALLLALAVYAKPSNALLALPLGVLPLLPSPGRPFVRGLIESSRRALVLIAAVVALYSLNWALTGEVNYQGGNERKTFYGKFPFADRDVTFGNSGVWMSTNQLGPSVQGGQQDQTRGAEPARPAEEFRISLLHSLGYFWIGRFAGALWYFFPVAVATALFVLRGPRTRQGWLALAALLVSQFVYVWRIPDNWYGGSGTLGNRYFLNLLPLAALLVPPGRALVVSIVGLVGAAVFVVPLFLAPLFHAQNPAAHTLRQPFLSMPVELTMLNDLAVFGDLRRKKQPYGDTEGDPKRPGSADPRAYFLYFPDDGTYFKESLGERQGFWMRGGQRAEILVRALEPARAVDFRLTGGPAGDQLRVDTGADQQTITLGPAQTRDVRLRSGRPFPYKETSVYVLTLKSSRGAPDGQPRAGATGVGTFVEIALDVEPKPALP